MQVWYWLGFRFWKDPPRHPSEGRRVISFLGHHFIPTGLKLCLVSFSLLFFLLQLLQDFHFLILFIAHTALTLAFPIISDLE